MIAPGQRIATIDVVRGVAVLGILAMNIVNFAMPRAAYMNPRAYGGWEGVDLAAWAIDFVLVDGKMRGLFSLLFGASMLLVIDRAEARGENPATIHYSRMAWLLAFGLAHLFLVWDGDILAHYALVGMIAFLFWKLPARTLLFAAIVALSLMYAQAISGGLQQVAKFEAMAAPNATPDQRAELEKELRQMIPSEEALAEDKAAHASIPAHVRATLKDQPWRPFRSVFGYGLETLGMMLIGMAGYKSGFLTGAWSRRRYATVAGVLVGASLTLYGYAAWRILQVDLDPFTYYPWTQIYVEAMHPFSALGYAALVMLILGRGGPVAHRFAAVGRAAFTNYLGATVIGTLVFFGMFGGLYGELSRGQAWLLVPLVWALMLLWSKWWLDRFRYGPFEWAWRSLSRWRWEPMRRGKVAKA